ncbi:MAG: ATP-binding protein [Bacteroidota bacterium]|nr:ATP-binding protein [Bacteroidota bacterium]
MSRNLVDPKDFLRAQRQSGYKNACASLAEIIENAIDALAFNIHITIIKQDDVFSIEIKDDGSGMLQTELDRAFLFGGTTKKDKKNSIGCYGVGFKQAGLSLARRIEFYTRAKGSKEYYNYLDYDEIQKNGKLALDSSIVSKKKQLDSNGTLVRLTKVDRLDVKYFNAFIKKLKLCFAIRYRYLLFRDSVRLYLNNERIQHWDPLYVMEKGWSPTGGKQYGKTLKYNVRVPHFNSISQILVRFVELPIQEWSYLPNKIKKKMLITSYKGVSIIRSDVEIDRGSYFVKPHQNYDYWWRMEIVFEPVLDQFFGVTNTKQGISPNKYITNILNNDLQSISRDLYSRVIKKFISLRSESSSKTKRIINENDNFIGKNSKCLVSINEKRSNKQLKFSYLAKEILYEYETNEGCDVITINKHHPIYSEVFTKVRNDEARVFVELFIFALIEAERNVLSIKKQKEFQKYLSKILALYFA